MSHGDGSGTGEASLPYNISYGFWILLHGHLLLIVLTIFRSYFGGFREIWREQPVEDGFRHPKGLCASKLGQMMLWKGEMNHGASSVILLWVVLPAVHSKMINQLGVDILFAYHAAWLGSKFAFMGPSIPALLSFLVEPRMWLTAGLVMTSWNLASWQSLAAFILLPLYGLLVNAFQYPQTVFGVTNCCSWCSSQWTIARYRKAMLCVFDIAPKTTCQWISSKFPTYLERERVILLTVDRFRGPDPPSLMSSPTLNWLDTSSFASAAGSRMLPRRILAVIIPALIAVSLLAVVFMSQQTRQRWKLERGVCTKDTGGVCSFFGCDTYRNAHCNRSHWHLSGSCVCGADMCAVDGMCVPRPIFVPAGAGGSALGAGTGQAPKKQALVFAGGGAKGVWEVGILKALCDPGSAASRNFPNWTMLVGTSIGAMNAGFFAQFTPEQQCTEGLQAALRFWGSIINQQSVMQSPSEVHFTDYDHTSCFRISQAPTIFSSFEDRGGFCDPSPGHDIYMYEVDPKLIRQSGMKLSIVATSLNTSQARWWNEKSDNIIDGILASGSLAPLMYPKRIGGELYVDGGLVANSPVLKAVQEGATDILVMLLDPLEVPVLSQKEVLGVAVLELEFELFMFKYFVETELERACELGAERGARIWGYAPTHHLGGLMDFEASKLSRMLREGYEHARDHAPFDLCHWLAIEKKGRAPSDGGAREALMEELERRGEENEAADEPALGDSEEHEVLAAFQVPYLSASSLLPSRLRAAVGASSPPWAAALVFSAAALPALVAAASAAASSARRVPGVGRRWGGSEFNRLSAGVLAAD